MRMFFMAMVAIVTTLAFPSIDAMTGAMCPSGCQEVRGLRSKGPPPPHLDENQRQEIKDKIEKVKELKDNPSLLRLPENQLPIVTLTAQQLEAAEHLNPGFFHRTHPEETQGNILYKRGLQIANTRICPSTEIWETITLAINGDDELVQVLQSGTSSSSNQWFLTDKCKYETSKITGHACLETVRYVTAYVIDLSSETSMYEFKEDWIKVFCCAAYA